MDKKTLYILDGYGFVFRAYHVQPPLTDPHGNPVGAIYGLTSMLLKFVNDFKPEYFCVALDSKGGNFRHDIYPEYKSHRPEINEDLKYQLPLIPQTLDSFNIKQVAKVGFEADDIIAYLADKAAKENYKVVIISSDKDLTQLINDDITMYDHLKGKKIDKNSIKEKYGVYPELMRDYLALIGDKSDNIPGAPGIGPKGALELLNDFGNLHEICNSTEKMKPGKRRESIENSKELIELSWELIGLRKDIGMEIKIEDLEYSGPDNIKIGNFINQNGFKSLKPRIETLFSIKIEEKEHIKKPLNIIQIKSKEALNNLFNKIEEAGIVGFLVSDLEGEKKEIELAYDEINSYYLEIDLKDPDKLELFDFSNKEESTWWTEFISKLMEHDSIIKITYDAKSLLKNLSKVIEINNFKSLEDLMLMQYSISAGKTILPLNEIIAKYKSNHVEISRREIVGMMIYAYLNLKSEVAQNKALELYYDVDLKMLTILNKMEQYGIKIDKSYLKKLSQDFEEQIKQISAKIFKITNKEFNIASSKQLGEILFDDLKIKGGKKLSKSGSYATSADILENLSEEGYEIADLLLEWRQFTKLKNTYTDSLIKSASEANSRIHTTFLQCVTSTGRLSSANPNLQNIPIRTSEGNKIRKAFISERNYQLISADYSQIELRLLSHVADIKVLQDAFHNNLDIHALTASQIFKVKLEEVTKELRQRAKAINFGIIYGISAFGLAKNISISRKNAQEYIDYYFKEYPGIKKYMEEAIDFAKNNEFVANIFGRKSFIPSINSDQPQLRNFSQRAAINAPLQSSASDIVKKAMVQLSSMIQNKGYKTKMLLQIHDELIFEAPIEEVQYIKEDIKNIMENIVLLKIPLKVSIKNGTNWQEMD